MAPHQDCQRQVTIDATCDYIIAQLENTATSADVLKIQKLLYYCQAWHLAFYNAPLFRGRFEAWVHGPVNRKIYDRFRDRSMYGVVTDADIGSDIATLNSFPGDDAFHVKGVLEAYGHLSGTQLEQLTHNEVPWQSARGDLSPNQRCNTELDEGLMASYYRGQLPSQ